MPTYKASVITEALYIDARNMAEAESKYNWYYAGDICPQHRKDWDECGCIEFHEEVDHEIRLYN